MPVKLILGLQHGDEGKGRIVDDFTESWADIIVRFQGGGNAGHTVYDKQGNKFVTHSLPVGVLHKDKLNIISKGCVLNIEELIQEIKELNVSSENLKISGLCPIIEPMHVLKDKLKYQGKIGTTAKGIGPAYSDFYARDSILLRDLIEEPSVTFEKIKTKYHEFALHKSKDIRIDQLKLYYECEHQQFQFMQKIQEYAEFLSKFILEDEYYLSKNLDKNIILEGAQGSGLNIYSDNYPNVTSSSPTIGGALNSTNLNHKNIDEVIGVIKSYKTKVGSGEFKTLCDEKNHKILATLGKEFGATTGRPRQCGWLDLDEVNEAIMQNGVDHLFITKTDVFMNIESPKVYFNGEYHIISNIKDINEQDEGFNQLLSLITNKTKINKISYTTGPLRGQIKFS